MTTSVQLSRVPRFLRRLGWPQILRLLIALVLVLVISLFFFFHPFQPQLVTLSFVVPEREADYWIPLIEKFQTKNPNIQINLANRRPSNPKKPADTDQLRAIYTSAFEKGKSPYDLIYMDLIWVSEFASVEWLRDISDYISNDELDNFLPSDIDAGRYKGKLYRIPFRTDTGVLYYRKDLLDQVKENPPETFEDLIRIAQKLQKQGTEWGYLWQGSRSEALSAMFVEVLHGYGGLWINPETRAVGLDKPEALKAVEFLRNTIMQGISPKGITTYPEDETRNLFGDGKAVFLRNWPDVWVQANAAGSLRGKIDIKPMVHEAGSSYSSGACKGGWGFGIAKNTEHPKEAWQAIQFFTSAAAQRYFVMKMSFVPSLRSLFIDPQIVDKYSHYPKLLQVIEENSVLRPAIPQYAKASEILQQYLSAALNGQQNSQEAMKAAAEETRKLLANS